AHGANEALSDRFCISSGGDINVTLSPEYSVSCDTGNDGCDGGYLDVAWDFFKTTGTVLDECFPYPAETYLLGIVPACPTTCTDGSSLVHYKSTETFAVTGVDNIMAEIYNNGPVEVSFNVYYDFEVYTSGIYEHTWGPYMGGHAVKAVGWGVEDGTDYWIIANSGGADWGEDGYFRIVKGVNECGIEGNVTAGTPDL
ncbi:uncharacterized protein NAEGRDRAFT_32592, partial [Aduncisulcus paluster]